MRSGRLRFAERHTHVHDQHLCSWRSMGRDLLSAETVDRPRERGLRRLPPEHVVLVDVPPMSREAPGRPRHSGGDQRGGGGRSRPVRVNVLGSQRARERGEPERLGCDGEILERDTQGACAEHRAQCGDDRSWAPGELGERGPDDRCVEQRAHDREPKQSLRVVVDDLLTAADGHDADVVAEFAKRFDLGREEGFPGPGGEAGGNVDQAHPEIRSHPAHEVCADGRTLAT